MPQAIFKIKDDFEVLNQHLHYSRLFRIGLYNYFSLFINYEGHFFLIRIFSLFSINNFNTGLATKHET